MEYKYNFLKTELNFNKQTITTDDILVRIRELTKNSNWALPFDCLKEGKKKYLIFYGNKEYVKCDLNLYNIKYKVTGDKDNKKEISYDLRKQYLNKKSLFAVALISSHRTIMPLDMLEHIAKPLYPSKWEPSSPLYYNYYGLLYMSMILLKELLKEYYKTNIVLTLTFSESASNMPSWYLLVETK